jgi:hypothetical protein
MFGAFRPTNVNLSGLLWYVQSLVCERWLIVCLKESAMEVVADSEGQCSGTAEESRRCYRGCQGQWRKMCCTCA